MTEKIDSKAEAFVALSDVQSKLGVQKSQHNNFGGYSYYTVDDILNELKPLLKEHQAAVYFNETLEVIGNRIYVHSTAHFVFRGYEILATGIAREEENPSAKRGAAQETGSAITYARKYALNSLFLISEDSVDPDSNFGMTQSRLANQTQMMNTQTHIQNEGRPTGQSRPTGAQANNPRPMKDTARERTSSTNVSSVVGQGDAAVNKPQTERHSDSVGENTASSGTHAPTSSNPSTSQDKPTTSDVLKRGIDAAISLGAEEEDVYVWKHEMEPNDAVRAIADFVRSKQEQSTQVTN